MPYQDFSKTVKGKRKYCMRNKKTGKEYCYDSAKEREEGKRIHEAFVHGFKPTRKKRK